MTTNSRPSQREHAALVVLENSRLLRSITRVLNASGTSALACPSFAGAQEALSGGPFHVLLYDQALAAQDESKLRAVMDHMQQGDRRPPIVLLSEATSQAEVADLFAKCQGGNLVAKIGQIDSQDLLVSVRKLLEKDIFGVEKYLRWGSFIHSHEARKTPDRAAGLESLREFLTELQIKGRMIQELVTVADEFLMNAIYDAPVSDGGDFIHADKSRREEVLLDGNPVVFEFGSDGRFVAIGCRDPYGSLKPDVVLASLARCLRGGADQISTGPGGAGLGLYLIYQYVDHLVVNIDPGNMTEFLGIVDVTRSAKERRSAGKSINIFTLPGA